MPQEQYIYASKNVTIYYSDQKKKIMHREDGPAMIHADGSTEWRINNKLHREDGPALEYSNGRTGWFLNGIELTEEQHALKTTPKY